MEPQEEQELDSHMTFIQAMDWLTKPGERSRFLCTKCGKHSRGSVCPRCLLDGYLTRKNE